MAEHLSGRLGLPRHGAADGDGPGRQDTETLSPAAECIPAPGEHTLNEMPASRWRSMSWLWGEARRGEASSVCFVATSWVTVTGAGRPAAEHQVTANVPECSNVTEATCCSGGGRMKICSPNIPTGNFRIRGQVWFLFGSGTQSAALYSRSSFRNSADLIWGQNLVSNYSLSGKYEQGFTYCPHVTSLSPDGGYSCHGISLQSSLVFTAPAKHFADSKRD